MSKKTHHPFVHELAAETKLGNVTRRDFFKYAALLGLSIPAAGTFLGLSLTETAQAAQEAGVDWKGLSEESPFEIKNLLIDRAKKACQSKGCTYLNAGRGNPDFLNTTARLGFALLLQFAAQEAASKTPDVGYRVRKKGLAERLSAFTQGNQDQPGGRFLHAAVSYALSELSLDPDEAAFQFVDCVQGDFYPDPPRIYPLTEAVVNDYLARVVFSGKPPKGKFSLFATEGATAAMIYIFNSLKENRILNPGDTVAIVTPIFSPYLELPLLADYGLKTVYIAGSEDMGWQIPDSEVAKLKDPSVKALYMVNPTNPTSVSLNEDTVKRMSETIRKHNPDMVIISDTVYASFVDNFSTFGAYLPENILGVYSFSKYFGVTGWRLGVVMVHENCVVDRLIKALPQKDQALLDMRYRLTSTQPREILFDERLEIDSRQVALAHTGGLSGPQQIGMCLFALFELLDTQFAYKKSIMDILKKRWAALYNALELEEPKGDNLSRYYALIDLGRLAEAKKGKAFADKMMQGHALDFLFRLADDHGTVCLPGNGFAGPEWSLRVALANISEKQCATVGTNILKVLDSYGA